MPPPEPYISASIEVFKVSEREFCDHLAIDEKRFIGLQHMRQSKMICLLCEKAEKEQDVKKHPGFKAVQSSIAKKMGVSQDRAGAILAASSRNASKQAHKENPRLNRVKGK